MLWLLWFLIPLTLILLFSIRRLKPNLFKLHTRQSDVNISTQLGILEERTKHLQGLEEKIERIKDKQDADSRELREKLYKEYSTRLQDAVSLLKETYEKMSKTAADAFRDVTVKQAETYKETTKHLGRIAEKLEQAFEKVEQREHTQIREELKKLRQKVKELEMDPLRVQLEEIAEAQAAQAVHEQSVKKVTAIFWPNNGELKFEEKIGQYVPDVYIDNHKIRIVADEVTTDNLRTVGEKIKKVANYMKGLNANVGYVIIPNAGIDPERLRELKRTVPTHGLYIVRITEYAVHLQVWHDIASTGIVASAVLVEKGHNFLQILEPIFDEFLAVMQKIEQRDEQDFKYRQNRYKQVKCFPAKILNALER